jgi:hypothetical protein
MLYALLLLVSDIYPNTPGNAVLWVAGGGFGGVIIMLLVQGVYARWGKKTVEETITAWINKPDQVKAREAEIRQVLENQIRRDDGLIALEIRKVINFFARDSAAEQRFRQTVRGDLNRLKDALNMLTRGSFELATEVTEEDIVPDADTSGGWHTTK